MSDQTDADISALLEAIAAGDGIRCGAETIRLTYDRRAAMLGMESAARPGVARMYAAWFLTADNRPLTRPGVEAELRHMYRVSRERGFPARPESVGPEA
jgi:hypothetical protein